MKSKLTREDILQIIEEEKQKIKIAAAKTKKVDKLPVDKELVSRDLKVVSNDGIEYVIGSKNKDGDYVLKDPEGNKHALAYKKLKSDFRVS
jgi:hypothetical protein